MCLERQQQQQSLAVERYRGIADSAVPRILRGDRPAYERRHARRRERRIRRGDAPRGIARRHDERLSGEPAAGVVNGRRAERRCSGGERRRRLLHAQRAAARRHQRQRQNRRLLPHSRGERRVVARVGRRLEERDVERDELRAGLVQPLQQLAVHRTVPGELPQARTARIVRRVHRRFVDAHQAQIGVLVVAVGKPEELRGDRVVVDAELRFVEHDEVLDAVRRRHRLARQQVEDRADQSPRAPERSIATPRTRRRRIRMVNARAYGEINSGRARCSGGRACRCGSRRPG